MIRTQGVSVLVAHAAATWFMTGLIWTVQTVHYPLFSSVGEDEFVRYEQRHSRSIGRLLAVPAGAEIVLAAIVAFSTPGDVSRVLAISAGALLVFIWVMTAVVQAPQHGRLATGWDSKVHRRLVGGNWWRTAAWTTRAAFAAFMVA